MISTTSLAGERELGYCVSCGYGFAGRTRLLADQRELVDALHLATEKLWEALGGSDDAENRARADRVCAPFRAVLAKRN